MDRGFNKLESPPSIALALGYPWEQHKGQRHFGPLRDWIGKPPRGTEVFVGKIPRDSDENELVPLFSRAGRIYTMRIMMDFSGFNRGFAFVRFTKKSEALRAVKMFNGYRIRNDRRIGVTLSVDNSRLFLGGLPKSVTKDEVFAEFSNLVSGVRDVIMYPNPKDISLNRGFAFLEFDGHQSAAVARRHLIPCPETRFGRLMVDWAEPEPEIDERIMEKVKILYVRNLNLNTTEETIANLFNCVIRPRVVQRVKKINDYAFVHFEFRSDAEKAMQILNEYTVDGSVIDVQWARPVEDKSLYKLKKLINKGLVDESLLYTSGNQKNVQFLDKNVHKKDDIYSTTRCFDYRKPQSTKIHSNYDFNNNDVTSSAVDNVLYDYEESYQSDDTSVSLTNDANNANYSINEKDYNSGAIYKAEPSLKTGHTYAESLMPNLNCDDYIQILENVCKINKWHSPVFKMFQHYSGYYLLHSCEVTVSPTFYMTPLCPNYIHSSYSYATDYEAKNDAAKNAIDFINNMFSLYNPKMNSNNMTTVYNRLAY